MTALHDFSSDELEYFECKYPEDLEHIFALHGRRYFTCDFHKRHASPSRPKTDRTFLSYRA